jgi:hypothetical protein
MNQKIHLQPLSWDALWIGKGEIVADYLKYVNLIVGSFRIVKAIIPPIDADAGVAKNVENSFESDESDEVFRKDRVDHHARRRPKKEKVGYF